MVERRYSSPMETRISFHADDVQLEGLLAEQSPSKGVVVTHPHPLFGGDMTRCRQLDQLYYLCCFT